LHHLTGVYANLIYKKWSYYVGKPTKVKKPYLEQLVFRGVQSELIPLLRVVGVFPQITCGKIFPQLQAFQDFYDVPDPKKENELKCMVKWLGFELTKPAPKHSTDEQKTKQPPRELKEVLKSAIFQ